MYNVDLVPGDAPIHVRDLKAGDVLRMFNGIQDTITLEQVEDLGPRQYGKRAYHLHLSDGSVSTYVDGDDVRYLATGGARGEA